MPHRTLYLQTTHLDLVAMTLVHLDAEEMGAGELGLLLGVATPKGWPPGEYDRDAMKGFRERLAAEGADSVGWYGWYAIRRRTALQSAALVGAGGFLGPPDASGAVELGFSILPAFRGNGHATELALALVDYALAQPGVDRVVAHTAVINRPTISVLMRCGLQAVAPGEKPGTVRFERSAGDALAEAEADEPEGSLDEDDGE